MIHWVDQKVKEGERVGRFSDRLKEARQNLFNGKPDTGGQNPTEWEGNRHDGWGIT